MPVKTYAFDLAGNRVAASDAVDGQTYYLANGIPVHSWKPRDLNNTTIAHYQRYPGERLNRIGNGNAIPIVDPDILFARIFAPMPPEPPAHHVANPNNPIPTVADQDEDDDDEQENEGMYFAPCQSLRQIHRMGLYDRPWAECRQFADTILYRAWLARSSFYRFEGGNLIVEAQPDDINYRHQTIRFVVTWSFSKDNKTYQHKRYLVLRFSSKDLFFNARNRLRFEKVEEENGSARWRPQVESVLIAGRWARMETYNGYFVADCSSLRQIYVLD